MPNIRSFKRSRTREREMRLVAVIPAHGRESLLDITLKRLKKQTRPLHAVVCVGDTASERKIAESNGADFIEFPNDPLGKKWQAGVYGAKELGATDIVILGSSDWISDNWCEFMSNKIIEGYDMVGHATGFFLHIQGDTRKMWWWPGYAKSPSERIREYRSKEPIGAGRILSKEILDKMEWRCFVSKLNRGLDRSTYVLAQSKKSHMCIVTDNNVCTVSVSCDKWKNMHKIEPWFRPLRPCDVDVMIRLFPEIGTWSP